MRRLCVLGLVCLGFIGSFGVAGCGSGSSPNTGSNPISVSITSPATPPTITQGQTVNITAAVTNDSAGKGVTWSLSGVGTLSGQTATAVTYNAPSSVTANGTATVTATSVADTSKTASLTINLTPPAAISVSITNKFSSIQAGAAAVTLNATVQNDSSNSGVSWTLTAGGATCSPTCGALSGATSTSVIYTPPSFVPASPNNAPTITATSVADATKSDTNAFTITTSGGGGGGGANAGLLSGQYAFLVQGEDSAVAGSFTANGSGGITGGTEDVVAPSTTLSGSDLSITTGTYTVGSDDRGTITYKDSNGTTFTFAIALGSVSSGVATNGEMIEFDSNPLEMTGSLALQNATAFSTSALTGNYAFTLTGWDATPNPQAVVGSFSASSGNIANGLFDENDAGSAYTSQTFTGTYGNVSSDGRGTFSLQVTGNTNTSNGVIYVVSASQWFGIAGSGGTSDFVLGGEFLQQSGGPYSLASLSGNVIFEDQSSNGAPAPHADLGLITFDSTNGTGSYSLDTVDGGSGGGTDSPATGTATYSLDSAANGRFTLTPQGASPVTIYMIAPNEAFTIDTSTAPDSGTIEAQSTGPFSTSSLQGTYFFGTLPLLSPPTGGTPPPPYSISSGVVTITAGGAVTGTYDSNSSGVSTSGTAYTDTYTVAASGRVTSTSGAEILYVVSSSKVYGLSVGTENPTITVIQK